MFNYLERIWNARFMNTFLNSTIKTVNRQIKDFSIFLSEKSGGNIEHDKVKCSSSDFIECIKLIRRKTAIV